MQPSDADLRTAEQDGPGTPDSKSQAVTGEEHGERLVRAIDDALARMDGGTYGICAVCGKPIPEERLDAVPYATLCVEDKRAEEHR